MSDIKNTRVIRAPRGPEITCRNWGAEAAMRNEFLRLSREIAATRAHVNDWPPPDISTILIVSSTVELVSWWLQQKKPLPIEAVATIYERIIIQPHVRGERIPPERTPRRRRSR